MAVSLPPELLMNALEAENLFSWNIRSELEIVPDMMVERVKEKLNELPEETDFEYMKFVFGLILVYEFRFLEDLTAALEEIEKLEKYVSSLRTESKDKFFIRISAALTHIIVSCKMHILMNLNRFNEATEASRQLIAKCTMDDGNKAAFLGVRSGILMEYGLYGNKVALNYAKEAVNVDSRNPYWHFLVGKAHARIRRVENANDIPCEEEKNAFEKAMEIDAENLVFMLFSAENDRETANRAFKLHRANGTIFGSTKNQIDKLNEKSATLYRKCIRLGGTRCPHTLFRAAKGLMVLPNPYRDNETAKQLLERGLEVTPNNPMGNHLLAMYYERCEKNVEKALEYLKICWEKYKVFGAHMDYLRLEFSRRNINAEEELCKMLDVYKESPRQCQLLCHLISYYVFVTSDLTKACEFATRSLRLDPNFLDFKHHRLIFVLRVNEPIPLMDVLIDELKIELEKETNRTGQKFKLFNEFLAEVAKHDFLVDRNGPRFLKKSIIESSCRWFNSVGKGRRGGRNKEYSVREPFARREPNLSVAEKNIRTSFEFDTKSTKKKENETRPSAPINKAGRMSPTLEELMNDWASDVMAAQSSTKKQAERRESQTYGNTFQSRTAQNDAFGSGLKSKLKADSRTDATRSRGVVNESEEEFLINFVNEFSKLSIPDKKKSSPSG